MVTQADRTSTGVIATIVLVGAFAMISISALLTALVRTEEADVDAVRPVKADLETVAALDQQQTAALHAAPHWVDKAAGKIGIPIERAMQLVLHDIRKDPAAASPPVPPGVVLPPTPPDVATPGAPPSVAPALAPSPAAPAPSAAPAAPGPAKP